MYDAKQDFTYYCYSPYVHTLVNTVIVCDRNIDQVERGDGPPEGMMMAPSNLTSPQEGGPESEKRGLEEGP